MDNTEERIVDLEAKVEMLLKSVIILKKIVLDILDFAENTNLLDKK